MSRYRTPVREVINRNTVVSLALEQGFNAFLPVYDGGVDFILYRESDNTVRKVQLKGRLMINKKYLGRDIWMAFPVGTDWYLMPHDEIVSIAETEGKALESVSWAEGGAYSWPKPSRAMLTRCAKYRFAPIGEVAAEAATEGCA